MLASDGNGQSALCLTVECSEQQGDEEERKPLRSVGRVHSHSTKGKRVGLSSFASSQLTSVRPLYKGAGMATWDWIANAVLRRRAEAPTPPPSSFPRVKKKSPFAS